MGVVSDMATVSVADGRVELSGSLFAVGVSALALARCLAVSGSRSFYWDSLTVGLRRKLGGEGIVG